MALGRAAEPPHQRGNRGDDEKHAVPLSSVNFGLAKATGDNVDEVEGEMGTMLVVTDYTTGMLRATPMARARTIA